MFALTQGLRRAVQTKPNGISTHFAGRRRTWQQTMDRVSRIAGALFALGVRPGDRVAILALNSDRYFELMYAIPWIGAAMVPINTRLAAPEIEYILSDSGAVALFIDTAMSHHLTALEDKMPGVREVVWLDDTSGPEGLLHFEDLTNYEPALDVGAADDDLAGLFYTGGTTGRSKGVMLTHTNLVVNALNGVAGIGFNADTTYIHSGADVPSRRRRLDLRRHHGGRPPRLRAALRAGRGAADHPDREGDARAVRADHDQHDRQPSALRRVRHHARCPSSSTAPRRCPRACCGGPCR